jgi:hypothetical protein
MDRRPGRKSSPAFRALAIAGFVAASALAILLAARVGPGAAGVTTLILAGVLVLFAGAGRV